MKPVYILSGARTAIGDFAGSLKSTPPARLGEIVLRAAMERALVAPDLIEHVVLGQVIPTSGRDAYVTRVAAVNAGIPIRAPALTVNRLCGSGLQAIVSAAQMIALAEIDIAAAGGVEVMSLSPHSTPLARFGQKMGSIELVDVMIQVLSDPFEGVHMGITAENVADKYGITRLMQDELAVQSHRRAARAQAEERFKSQIVPVEISKGRTVTSFEIDEHVKAATSLASLEGLRPAFRKDGSVTAGNASSLNDGAAAVILSSDEARARSNGQPAVRILGWGHAGVEPSLMGIGPVQAVPIALRRAGLALAAVDVIESNEAFAAQACAVARELGFDPDKVNPNGSGVSLGHPVGATGAILTVKAMYELERIGGRYGLITMCIGGGQGIAMVIERVV